MTKQIGRPSTWDQHADEMVRLYEDEKKSRGDIARQYGTSVQTVTRVLSRHGVVFEGRQGNPNAGRTPEQQAAINAKISAAKLGRTYEKKPREARTCEQCGTEYAYRPGRTGERFCSRSCRNVFNAKTNQQTSQEVYTADPKLCPCGDPIPFEYRHTRMFCSPEHRSAYAAKRQADPANSVTFNCLTCDKEVTRYKNYGNGHNKYCSNACATKHTKVKKHYGVEGLEIVFDSSYECLFWGLCMLHKIPIERYDRARGVAWKSGVYEPDTFQNAEGWYAPDFWLPMLNTAVELKGLEDHEDTVKWTAFRAARSVSLVVMSGIALRQELGSMATREGLLAVLHSLASTKDSA